MYCVRPNPDSVIAVQGHSRMRAPMAIARGVTIRSWFNRNPEVRILDLATVNMCRHLYVQ